MLWRRWLRAELGVLLLVLGSAVAFADWAEARRDESVADPLAGPLPSFSSSRAAGRIAGSGIPLKLVRVAASRPSHMVPPPVPKQQSATVPPPPPKITVQPPPPKFGVKEHPKGAAPAPPKGPDDRHTVADPGGPKTTASAPPKGSLGEQMKTGPHVANEGVKQQQVKPADGKATPRGPGLKGGMPHLGVSDARHVEGGRKAPPADTSKIQDRSAKQHPSDPIAAAQVAARQRAREAETKQQDTSKQRLKEEMAKLSEGPKHQLPAAAAKGARESAGGEQARARR